MDNLFEIRKDIKHRLAFEKKLKEHPDVVQFFFTLEKFLDCHSKYESHAVPNQRGSRMFSSMVIRKGEPSTKEQYATFDDYLNMMVFKSAMPPEYNLVGQPHIGMSVIEIDNCLSHWSDTESLYKAVHKRILDNKSIDLHLLKDEPTVLTLHKLLTPEDYEFIKKSGRDSVQLPFVSLLPFSNTWKFHKHDCKEFLQITLFCLVIAILGVIGILLDKQPYTWIGAAAISILVGAILGCLIYNIVTLFTKGTPKKGEWVPGVIGLAAGVLCFFCTYSATHPSQSEHYYAPPSTYSDTGDYDDNKTVYITEHGKCYHSTPNYPSLYRSHNIYKTTKGRAIRTHRPCKRCN